LSKVVAHAAAKGGRGGKLSRAHKFHKGNEEKLWRADKLVQGEKRGLPGVTDNVGEFPIREGVQRRGIGHNKLTGRSTKQRDA